MPSKKPLMWWEWLGIGLRRGVEEVFTFYNSDIYSKMRSCIFRFIENRPISGCSFFKYIDCSKQKLDLLTGGLLRFQEKWANEDSSPEPVFAVGQTAASHPTWVSAEGHLPCFTKSGTKRLFHGKLAVTWDQAKAAGLKRPVDWEVDCGFHERVGNGQQVQNVGLVLLTALASLRVRPDQPSKIFEIAVASTPNGLEQKSTGAFILSTGLGKYNLGKDRESAISLHKLFHASCLKERETLETYHFYNYSILKLFVKILLEIPELRGELP